MVTGNRLVSLSCDRSKINEAISLTCATCDSKVFSQLHLIYYYATMTFKLRHVLGLFCYAREDSSIKSKRAFVLPRVLSETSAARKHKYFFPPHVLIKARSGGQTYTEYRQTAIPFLHVHNNAL